MDVVKESSTDIVGTIVDDKIIDKIISGFNKQTQTIITASLAISANSRCVLEHQNYLIKHDIHTADNISRSRKYCSDNTLISSVPIKSVAGNITKKIFLTTYNVPKKELYNHHKKGFFNNSIIDNTTNIVYLTGYPLSVIVAIPDMIISGYMFSSILKNITHNSKSNFTPENNQSINNNLISCPTPDNQQPNNQQPNNQQPNNQQPNNNILFNDDIYNIIPTNTNILSYENVFYTYNMIKSINQTHNTLNPILLQYLYTPLNIDITFNFDYNLQSIQFPIEPYEPFTYELSNSKINFNQNGLNYITKGSNMTFIFGIKIDAFINVIVNLFKSKQPDVEFIQNTEKKTQIIQANGYDITIDTSATIINITNHNTIYPIVITNVSLHDDLFDIHLHTNNFRNPKFNEQLKTIYENSIKEKYYSYTAIPLISINKSPSLLQKYSSHKFISRCKDNWINKHNVSYKDKLQIETQLFSPDNQQNNSFWNKNKQDNIYIFFKKLYYYLKYKYNPSKISQKEYYLFTKKIRNPNNLENDRKFELNELNNYKNNINEYTRTKIQIYAHKQILNYEFSPEYLGINSLYFIFTFLSNYNIYKKQPKFKNKFKMVLKDYSSHILNSQFQGMIYNHSFLQLQLSKFTENFTQQYFSNVISPIFTLSFITLTNFKNITQNSTGDNIYTLTNNYTIYKSFAVRESIQSFVLKKSLWTKFSTSFPLLSTGILSLTPIIITTSILNLTNYLIYKNINIYNHILYCTYDKEKSNNEKIKKIQNDIDNNKLSNYDKSVAIKSIELINPNIIETQNINIITNKNHFVIPQLSYNFGGTKHPKYTNNLQFTKIIIKYIKYKNSKIENY